MFTFFSHATENNSEIIISILPAAGGLESNMPWEWSCLSRWYLWTQEEFGLIVVQASSRLFLINRDDSTFDRSNSSTTLSERALNH